MNLEEEKYKTNSATEQKRHKELVTQIAKGILPEQKGGEKEGEEKKDLKTEVKSPAVKCFKS